MNSSADKNFRENMSWEEKAKRNPLFAVMSAEQFGNVKPNEWTEKDLEIFFAKGQFMYDIFLKPIIQRLRLNKEKAFIVEYGSGIGRILRIIKVAGFNCAGIDASPTMLEYSRKLVPEVSQLFCIDAEGKCDIPSDSADFVYSYAVIQHISRLSGVKKAISEMCRILKPGGYMKFQFRTIKGELPFRKLKSFPKEFLYNFEDKSLVIFHDQAAKFPRFKFYDHNNWLGVPLSFDNMEEILNNCGIVLVGVEQDVGKKGNMLWALATKCL